MRCEESVILKKRSANCFELSDNYIRITFYKANVIKYVTPQVTPQVESMLLILDGELSRAEIQEVLNLADRKHFSQHYLNPALADNLIEMTIPDKPKSSLQKYRITSLGRRCIAGDDSTLE